MQRSELEPAVAELLAGFPVVVTTMVAWGDMDANRHVNNTVYFRSYDYRHNKKAPLGEAIRRRIEAFEKGG